MIQVKAPVSGWHTVTEEQALQFVIVLIKGAWNGTEKTLEYANNHLIRGIKFTKEDIEHGRSF